MILWATWLTQDFIEIKMTARKHMSQIEIGTSRKMFQRYYFT